MKKKFIVLATVNIIAITQCFAVVAAITAGFKVAGPSRTYLNEQYLVSGGVSYTRPSSGGATTYYLQDVVSVTYKGVIGPVTVEGYGVGYNIATTILSGITKKPIIMVDEGYYRNGTGSYISVGRIER